MFVLRDDKCIPVAKQHFDKLEPIQIAGAITGGVLFILSFLNIANVLYDIKIIFFLVIIAIIVMAGALFFGAYVAFTEPCVASLLGLNSALFSKNAFEAEDGHNIAVMVLDVIGGLMLLSIGGAFGKRL